MTHFSNHHNSWIFFTLSINIFILVCEYLYIHVFLFLTKLYLIKFLLTFPSSSVSPFSSFSSDFSSVLSLAAPAADVDAAFQLNACFAFFFGLAGFFFPFFGFSQAFCATFFCVLSSFCVQK